MMDVISVWRKGLPPFETLITNTLKASNKGTIRIAIAKADPFASKSNTSYFILDSTILTAKLTTRNLQPVILYLP